MITLGIDLSSQPKNTAACRIDWTNGYSAKVEAPFLQCDDAKLDELIGDSEVVGIDAPFGWPGAFRAAVAEWQEDAWCGKVEFQKSLRLRITDRAVQGRFKSSKAKLTPLSVSTDRISLPAMRAMALLKRHGVTDKSGDGRFYEVYPAGTLACWNLPCCGYKIGPLAAKQRGKILAGIRRRFPQLKIPQVCLHSDHALDALVASITSKFAKDGNTVMPSDSELASARSEGWIHLPRHQLP